MDPQQAEQDRFRLGGGEHRDVRSLPPHLKRLHRRIARQAREDRMEQIDPSTDDERRWPGLVTPNE
jgi:hypothetical protein